MKQLFGDCACVLSGERDLGRCVLEATPVRLRVNKAYQDLGLMQHAANSRVNCKTVRADEERVSLRTNPIL